MMKKQSILILLTTVSLLSCGCVTRTYTDEPEIRGSTGQKGKSLMANPNAKITSQKRIWFWQKEFKNPQ